MKRDLEILFKAKEQTENHLGNLIWCLDRGEDSCGHRTGYLLGNVVNQYDADNLEEELEAINTQIDILQQNY